MHRHHPRPRSTGHNYAVIDVSEGARAFAFALVQGLGYRQVPVVIAGEQRWANLRPDMISALGGKALRLPIDGTEEPPVVEAPFVLVTPTYGGGGDKGAVPKPVIRFLNNPDNRRLIRRVIAAGNTNFGGAYGRAGKIVAEKCAVPLLYRFELLGTEEDVSAVRHVWDDLWWIALVL